MCFTDCYTDTEIWSREVGDMKIVAVRVPDEWKTRMEKADVVWSEILRRAIRETLDGLEREERLAAWANRPTPPECPEGTAARSIREDRDARG